MKSFLFYISISISGLLLSSCSGFLDEDPRSLITPDDYFQVETDAQSAVDAIYTHFHGQSVFARYYWVINELASDNGQANSADPDLQEFSTFSLTPQNRIVQELWTGLYAAIHTTNFAIENIPNTPISEPEQMPLLAEAHFFRGWLYFELLRFFGEVPLGTNAVTDAQQNFDSPRMPVDSLYVQIIEDLTFAFENLPDVAASGRPSGNAALALVGKVYLHQGNFGRAFGFFRAVVQAGQYALLPDYASVFQVGQNNSSEIVFALNYSALDPAPMNQRNLPPALNGRAKELPLPALVGEFDSLDRRFSVSFLDQYRDANGTPVSIPPHVAKYWDRAAEPQAGPTANDLPIIRYADVLLMFAEAINEVRKGTDAASLNAINSVRARARFDGSMDQNVLPNLGTMNYADFRIAILAERRRELAWEGHRWFDLVRFGQLEERVQAAKPNTNVSQTHYLLPIPQAELEKNPNLGPQNPGY